SGPRISGSSPPSLPAPPWQSPPEVRGHRRPCSSVTSPSCRLKNPATPLLSTPPSRKRSSRASSLSSPTPRSGWSASRPETQGSPSTYSATLHINMRASARGLAAFLLLAFVLPGTALAQEKSLHWAALAVHAQLDAMGVLHVEERHAMVFTGDWNGGE